MKQLLKELEKLNLPNDQYAIFGSGPMGIRGLKEIDDLDLVVTDELFEKLKEKYPEEKSGLIKIGNIEIFPYWHSLVDNPEKVIKRAETIDGFKFITLLDLIAWKRKMGREKDFKDIKIIENYLQKRAMQVSVRAVIIQSGQVLTLRREFYDGDTIWTFPGGHIEEFDEDEKKALRRECLEEVNLEIKVGEKIFEQNFKGTINNFYLCMVTKGEAGYGNGPEYNQPEKYRGSHHPEWLPLKDLKNYDLRPNKLRDKIIN